MSGPHISIPRPYGGSTNFGSTAPNRRRSEIRMPKFFKRSALLTDEIDLFTRSYAEKKFSGRLFKFPQMDFEMAIWEMTHLMYAPKKVFKSIYYHKRNNPPQSLILSPTHHPSFSNTTVPETKNTWHRPDPSFTYLLSFFLLLTSLAWSLAYSPSPSSIAKLALMFLFVHFLGPTLFYATLAYFLVSRFLTSDRRIPGLPSSRRRRRQQGLFAPPPASGPAGAGTGAGGGEKLEFGYSFDVGIRAFFPVYVLLYVVQFILMPLLAHHNALSRFFANTLYLVAHSYWTVIIFLGYNTLHFLHHTELLLAPLVAWVGVWLVATLSGFNMAEHVGEWMFWGVKKF
jgi:UNC-50 family